MDPEKFLLLGEELVKRATPADCRTAIGRAYYGVLQATATCIEDAGLSPPRQNEIHQKIWQDLLNCGVPELKGPGSEMAEMHGIRIKADYRMKDREPEDRTTAEYWVEIAREHFAAIKGAFIGPNRNQVIQAIRDYRQRVNRPV